MSYLTLLSCHKELDHAHSSCSPRDLRWRGTVPFEPGKPEKREHKYLWHGTQALLASCVVPTGHVVWHLDPTRTSADFAAHLANVVSQLPLMHRYDWVVDNLNTH